MNLHSDLSDRLTLPIRAASRNSTAARSGHPSSGNREHRFRVLAGYQGLRHGGGGRARHSGAHSVHRADRVVGCQRQSKQNTPAEWDRGRVARRESLGDLGIGQSHVTEPAVGLVLNRGSNAPAR